MNDIERAQNEFLRCREVVKKCNWYFTAVLTLLLVCGVSFAIAYFWVVPFYTLSAVAGCASWWMTRDGRVSVVGENRARAKSRMQILQYELRQPNGNLRQPNGNLTRILNSWNTP